MKLKTRCHFIKWNVLNIVFVTQHIHSVLRISTALQIFFYVCPLKREIKWRRFLVQRIQFKSFYFETQNIIMFLARNLFFNFLEVHNIHNVASTLRNVAEIDLKNDFDQKAWYSNQKVKYWNTRFFEHWIWNTRHFHNLKFRLKIRCGSNNYVPQLFLFFFNCLNCNWKTTKTIFNWP